MTAVPSRPGAVDEPSVAELARLYRQIEDLKWQLDCRFIWLYAEQKRDRELAVKRIVGLLGEEVSVRRGIFYINGRPLPEPYVDVRCFNDIGPARLSPEQFVVTGDNRAQTFTAIVHRKRILGRLVLWRDLLRFQ